MKKNTGNKIRLGVFITVGLVIFIMAIYYIGQKQWLFTSTITVTAYFDDVTGLEVGNKVRFTGINVGTVADISIVSDTSAKVELIIDRRAIKFIKKDAIAMIGSEGLMGSKVVNIGPGSGNQTIADKDVLRTLSPPSIDAIMAKLEITVENAAFITDDLATITFNIKNGRGVIGKLLMDSSYATDIGQTLTNMKNSTQGINELVPAVKNNFLLRGYYRKQRKAEAEREKEATKLKEEQLKESKDVKTKKK